MIMNKTASCSVALGLLFTLTSSGLLLAVDRPGAPPLAAVKRVGQSLATPLTDAECTGLGGKVVDTADSKCTTGQACYTTDSKHVVHTVCLSQK